MRKVYEIFSSSSVDPSVKKSAVDQLAIILQDHNLHAPFKAEGGVETVLKHLKLGLVRNDEAQVKNSVLSYQLSKEQEKTDVLLCTPVLDNSMHCFTNVANDYLFTLKLRI